MPSVLSLIVTLSFVATLACAGGGAPPSDDRAVPAAPAVPNAVAAREAIEAANARLAEALLKRDVASIGANYTDDALIMMPGETTWVGREAIELKLNAMLQGTTFTAATFATDEVLLGGDLAVERGSGTWTYTRKAGQPLTERVKYLTVWRRQPDGTLRIIRNINNSDEPASTSR